jgi:hypothetical protein
MIATSNSATTNPAERGARLATTNTCFTIKKGFRRRTNCGAPDVASPRMSRGPQGDRGNADCKCVKQPTKLQPNSVPIVKP